MRWDRRRVRAVVAAFVVVVATSFLLKLASDGGTSEAGDPPSAATSAASPTVQSGDTDPESGLPWVLEEELPPEAQGTLALIDRGGPFPYPDRDGSVFGNYEGLLPDHPRGYYHEYTVLTPGSQDRGARRIITGDADEFYWTGDHYKSFERILRRGP